MSSYFHGQYWSHCPANSERTVKYSLACAWKRRRSSYWRDPAISSTCIKETQKDPQSTVLTHPSMRCLIPSFPLEQSVSFRGLQRLSIAAPFITLIWNGDMNLCYIASSTLAVLTFLGIYRCPFSFFIVSTPNNVVLHFAFQSMSPSKWKGFDKNKEVQINTRSTGKKMK